MANVLRVIAVFSVISLHLAAIACAVPHVATAAEIIDGADLIVLVTVPDVTIEEISPLRMNVVEVLKGDFKAKTITVHGQTARYHGRNDHPIPYNFVRLGGRFGNCFAEDYQTNGQFLLFLRGGTVQWSPLAATNEEVSGPKDPWVVWVKRHLRQRSKI